MSHVFHIKTTIERIFPDDITHVCFLFQIEYQTYRVSKNTVACGVEQMNFFICENWKKEFRIHFIKLNS